MIGISILIGGGKGAKAPPPQNDITRNYPSWSVAERSAIMCIRGARSSLRCPIAEAPIAVQVAEAHI